MRKRNIIIALSAFLLSSCGLTGSVESLLMPPIVSEDQEAVYDALMDDTGRNITLVYPRTGDYRSAFIFRDLDGDGTDEAVAFYRSEGESSNVRVNILSAAAGIRCTIIQAAATSSKECFFRLSTARQSICA